MHVRAHQSAIGVVVLEERYERSGNGDQLLRANVNVIDFLPADQHEVAGFAGVDQFRHDAALVIEFNVRLRNGVAIFFPRGKIERKWIDLRRLFALLFQFGVDLLDLMLFHVIADFVIAVSRVHHGDVVDHAAALDPAVRRFNKAIVVDAGVAAQRRNQSDVRTFRRFNRADTAIMRGMHVADFESGALP